MAFTLPKSFNLKTLLLIASLILNALGGAGVVNPVVGRTVGTIYDQVAK